MYKRQSQMTLSDRLAIEVGIERKESFKTIAKRLNRHPSTIAHEVKENRTFIQGNYPGGNDCKYARHCLCNIYAGKMTVITSADFVRCKIVTIIVKDTFQSDAVNGNRLHMSAIPVIKRGYAGKISTFIQHNMQMQQ